MHGVAARREIIHYGFLYAFEQGRLEPGPPVPDFLLGPRERAAALSSLQPEEYAEALMTRYPPGASIGWHRNAPPFGPVIAGISLGAGCPMRFREKSEAGLPSRSCSNPGPPTSSRGPPGRWQHSIRPVRTLRYSATFRTLRSKPSPRCERAKAST